MMYINQTETELANKIRTMSAVETVKYLMEQGLALNPDVKDYTVTLTFDVEAMNPEDAVKEMIGMINQERSLWDFEYTVMDEKGNETEISAYHIPEEYR